MAFSFRKLFSTEGDDEPRSGAPFSYDESTPGQRANRPASSGGQLFSAEEPILLSDSDSWRSRGDGASPQAENDGVDPSQTYTEAQVHGHLGFAVSIAELVRHLPRDVVRPGVEELSDVIEFGDSFFFSGSRQGFQSTRLSSIFRILPELFVRDVGPAEDREIFIPDVAFLRKPELAATAVAAPPAVLASSPFQMPSGMSNSNGFQPSNSASPSPFGSGSDIQPISSSSTTPTASASPFGGSGSADSSGGGMSNSPFKKLGGGGTPFQKGASGSSPAPSSATPAKGGLPQPKSSAPISEDPVSIASSTSQPETESPAPADGEISLSLHKILRSVTHSDLGFDPSKVPSHVKVNLPVDAVRNQLPTGRVELPITKIAEGCEERYRPAFAKAKSGLLVNIPLQEIFHNLPSAEGETQPQSVVEKVVQKEAPIQTEAEADASKKTPPRMKEAAAPTPGLETTPISAEPEAEPVTSIPQQPAPISAPGNPLPLPPKILTSTKDPLKSESNAVTPEPTSAPVEAPSAAPVAESKAPEVAGEPEQKATAIEDTEEAVARALRQVMAGLTGAGAVAAGAPVLSANENDQDVAVEEEEASSPDPLTEEAPTPQPFSDPAPLAASSTTPAPEISLGLASKPKPTPEPIPTPAPKMSSTPAVSSKQPAASSPRPAASSESGSSSGRTVAGASLEFRSEEIPDQLELRAIFGISRKLSAQEVVDHCEALAGVEACLAIGRGNDVVKAANHYGASGDHGNFYDRSATIFETVIKLAGEIGIDDVTILNVKTNSGCNTYFRYGDACLAVLLNGEELQPGVREKLIVVARELSHMI